MNYTDENLREDLYNMLIEEDLISYNDDDPALGPVEIAELILEAVNKLILDNYALRKRKKKYA